ncbi:MAG: hypothetical protein ACLFUZ_05325 [Candidatus Micrarchaeia archaeon]
MSKCKFCGEECGTYELCRSCYYDAQDGEIDKCKCGKYKDSEYALCFDCYKKSNSGKNYKKSKIHDSSIKGRLAEAIIEEMFISMGYDVFRFGMENTLPGFSNRFLPKKGEVANQVRKMPDFIVVKDSHVSFVEVKYRTNEEFDFKEQYSREGGYPYPNAYFILVSPKHIRIQKASELEKGKDFMWLGSCKDFETDKEIIKQYIEFCKKFFGNC